MYLKSLNYYKLYKQADDSLISENNIKKVTAYEINRQIEKEKQAAEEEQKRKDEVQALELKRKSTGPFQRVADTVKEQLRNPYIAAAAGALAAVIVMAVLYALT